MSSTDVPHTHPLPVMLATEQQPSAGKSPVAAVQSDSEKSPEVISEASSWQGDADVVLVDYDENDPENPLNWTSTRKWLIVCAVSWMGFVSVFATMTITPTAPQVLQEFHSHSALERTLLVTIWELGEGIGPFLIAPLSERYGRLPVFHVGNFFALLCLIGAALSVNISMLIAFRFLTGCFLSILTLGPAIVGDLFEMEQTGLTMALVMITTMIADFISPLSGAYIAQDLGWRWSVWLAAIVLGFFSFFLLLVYRETYSVVILKRKAARLQKQSTDGKKYRSKHQARVDKTTILESVFKPLHIVWQSPILMLTTAYMTVRYSLVSLLIATLTETMEYTYPHVFSRGSVGLTFLSLAIGNTIALIFYSLTSDRYIVYQKKKKGDAFRPESRLVHLLLGAAILPMGFLLYGWALNYHVQYIVPLIGTTFISISMTLTGIPIETYIVDVYKIYGASAIAAGVIFRATSGAFLPLIGPPLYQSIGYGWGNSVLALLAAIFIPPIALLMKYGEWFRSKERFGTSER